MSNSSGYPHIPDHADRAVALLGSSFRTPGFEALVRACVAPVQVMEDFCAAVYTGLNVDSATGYALELLGALVGEQRGTLADDEYRRLVKAKARALRSTGAVVDALAVANLALAPDGGARVVELPPCYYEVTLPADPSREFSAEMRVRVRRVLELARPAGWGAQYIYHVANPFAFDGPPELGWDEGGFADIL
jgi:hypothetical protein